MAALLHVPDFQLLESAWRALFFLVRRVETSERLKMYLLDVSKTQLAADLLAAEELRSSGLWKLVEERTVGTPGAEPWAVLVGNYTFEPTRKDAELLARIAKLARAAGAPFLAAASPRLLGCQSVYELPHPRDWEPKKCAGRRRLADAQLQRKRRVAGETVRRGLAHGRRYRSDTRSGPDALWRP